MSPYGTGRGRADYQTREMIKLLWKNVGNFLPLQQETMKYSELHRLLKKAGCYVIGNNRHPRWYSPITKNQFQTSHHESEEVKTGTLQRIKRLAGI